MTKRTALRWIERSLLATGAALALWCAFVVLRAEYFRRLPVPAPTEVTSVRTEELPPARPQPRPERGAWVARLEAPSVGLTATILEGSDDRTLSKAAGHLEETAFPGENGNFTIAAHRDTIFRPVRKLHTGDDLVLTTADRVYRYRIAKTTIVNPDDVWVLKPAGHPTMTLVTCYPFEFIGHAPRRYIVSADLVSAEPRTVVARTDMKSAPQK